MRLNIVIFIFLLITQLLVGGCASPEEMQKMEEAERMQTLQYQEYLKGLTDEQVGELQRQMSQELNKLSREWNRGVSRNAYLSPAGGIRQGQISNTFDELQQKKSMVDLEVEKRFFERIK